MASLSSSVPRVSVRLIIITRERRGSKGASAAKAAADASARAVYQQSIRARITTLFSIASCLFYYLLTRPPRHIDILHAARAAGGRVPFDLHSYQHFSYERNQINHVKRSRRLDALPTFSRLVSTRRVHATTTEMRGGVSRSVIRSVTSPCSPSSRRPPRWRPRPRKPAD
jgi:hypothetical protein